MKVLIWHSQNSHAVEIEDVDTVTRQPAYVQIIKGVQSWTYPWHALHHLKVEDVHIG